MSQGRAPLWASSTIFCLVESGSGLPFTNTPPSWFTPLWPTWRQKHPSHRNGVKKPADSTCNKAKGVATEWWGGWRMRSVGHRLEWDYIRRQKKIFISPDLNNKNIYVYRRPVKTFCNVISALQYAILYNIFICYAFRKLCRIKKRPNCHLKSKEFFFLIINLNIDRPHTFFCPTYKLWTLKTFPSFSIQVQLRVASISTSPINSDINISGSSNNNNNLNY